MQQLDPTELAAFCADHAAALLLDVREPWEVALAAIRIDGAAHADIPMGELPARLAEIDPARPVVCICHHGMRSAQVVAFLMQRGLQDVYNLDGGIAAWSTLIDSDVPQY